MPVGQPSRLTIRLTNPNPTALTGVRFEDRFPAGLEIADPPEATSTCGEFAAFPGSRGTGIEGGTIPASGECTISMLVVATATGPLTNTIAAGAVVSDNAPASTAPTSAVLTAFASGGSPLPIPSLSPLGLVLLASLLAVTGWWARGVIRRHER